ncbi:Amastin surface glycoprotein, putative [Trypanosoma equiperdum]|uniref:Amastin n=4 Tax=Trypanozoon TaxID=39700 RepID=Q585K0_TRYB2|nr:hypothetical protein, conserved [Trypanosoma brucei brucei TREU927]AAX79205.1 hypothetical protein, conserved [Trypanosoma brucei]AAZ10941.1 hypothetical protein, conserved [Trypanosoma brucei brucei TREU927]RHW73099.1 Amastin surface glycoprotein [Trypanosoma brucei equiperdum]SCU65815.1 Amastin surface glycoprotein, putative [Trypanosoma equiperdum]
MCCGWLTTLVTLFAVASAVCALVFPVFRMKNETKEAIQTLWYYMEKVDDVVKQTKVHESPCKEYSVYFQVIEAGVLISVLTGFAALVFIILSNCKIPLCCLRIISTPLSIISFLVSSVSAVLITVGYGKGFCQWDDQLREDFAPFKERDFSVDAGFYLIVVTAVLFLVSSVAGCCL